MARPPLEAMSRDAIDDCWQTARGRPQCVKVHSYLLLVLRSGIDPRPGLAPSPNHICLKPRLHSSHPFPLPSSKSFSPCSRLCICLCFFLSISVPDYHCLYISLYLPVFIFVIMLTSVRLGHHLHPFGAVTVSILLVISYIIHATKLAKHIVDMGAD